jgi:hypothetical protein
MKTTTPADLSQTEKDKIAKFLTAHPVGVLATVDEQGNPHASALYFSVDEALRVRFTTKRDTVKYANICRNNTIMLVAYEPASQTVVQISGKAVEATDPDDQRSIYHGTLQAAKQTGEDIVPPIAKIAAGPYVAFTIDIENIWMTEYGWGNNFAKALKHANDPHATGDPA